MRQIRGVFQIVVRGKLRSGCDLYYKYRSVLNSDVGGYHNLPEEQFEYSPVHLLPSHLR